ncbi:MAG: pilus assembly protein TadG-related protein [Steroidobacteraceae bacterium]|jgi:hypothetical protein|nr:pilus assembly protein TadG-related protein [Steroidobacteraceae bacterium]
MCTHAARRRPRAGQRGQSLVFVLAFLAVLVAVFVASVESGRAVVDQQRLVNAADAAALGAATWQARTLNAQAYMNRAIVANEVAIAQAVSLRSWSDYLRQTLANVRTLTSAVPYVGAATQAVANGWTAADRTIQVSARAVEASASTVEQILAGAQEAVNALGPVAAAEIARATLRAHSPEIAPSAEHARLEALNVLDWRGFTVSYAGSGRERLRATVLDARDGFTRSRSHRLGTGPLSPVLRVEKRGGTELLGFEAWRGLDTLSIHRRSGFLFGRFREQVPLGWGGAEDALRPSRLPGDHDGTWRVNPSASGLADRALRAHGRAAIHPGLPATRDVREPWRRDERRLSYAVEAELRRANSAPAPRARALAHAVVEFARPEPRADGRREYPSLYSPYWRARLAPVTARQRVLVRGPLDPFAAVAP